MKQCYQWEPADFRKNFAKTEAEAMKGNPSKWLELGLMYAKGVPDAPRQDFDKAETCILKAHSMFESANAIHSPHAHAFNPASGSLELKYIDAEGVHRSILSGDPSLTE